MAIITPTKYAILVFIVGVASFILGIFAELKKPAGGEVITGKGVVICKYPSNPSLSLGYLSTAFLAVSTVLGCHSLFYPYKGKSIPKAVIFNCRWCFTYFSIATLTSVFAAFFLLWPTIQGNLHRKHNIYHDLEFNCPTAKTGLLGGCAFMSLNASLLWLVALMLTINAREDYFEDTQESETI